MVAEKPMTMFPKKRLVRLRGEALLNVIKQVYEREGGCCAICGRFISTPDNPTVKPHHELARGYGGKSDEADKMILLCYDCHQKRHFQNVEEMQKKCEEYLKNTNR